MKEETRLPEYVRRASAFLHRTIGDPDKGAEWTLDSMKAALDKYATEHPSSSWRIERSCLARWLESVNDGEYTDMAAEIRQHKNPVDPKQRPPRPPRARKIREADVVKLLKALAAQKDEQACAAIMLGYYLGLRPAEMPFVAVELTESGCTARIPRAKQRGDRSLDESVVHLSLPPDKAREIAQAAATMRGATMRPIQYAIRRAAKDLWPTRKTVPSLLTLRHQLGSNLKASGMDRREAAAIFGHKSQDSLHSYGRSRSGGGGVQISADQSTIDLVSERPPKDPGAVEAMEPLPEIEFGQW